MLSFWRHGYETTSIADLTAAMGITAPSIYTAFGDKRRLFLAAMRRYVGDPEDLRGSLAAAKTARHGVHAMLVARGHRLHGGGNSQRLFIGQRNGEWVSGIGRCQVGSVRGPKRHHGLPRRAHQSRCGGGDIARLDECRGVI